MILLKQTAFFFVNDYSLFADNSLSLLNKMEVLKFV